MNYISAQCAELERVHAIIRSDWADRHEDRHRGYAANNPATWGAIKGQRKTPSGRRSGEAAGWLTRELVEAANQIGLGFFFVARDVDIKPPSYLRVQSGMFHGDFSERQQEIIANGHEWSHTMRERGQVDALEMSFAFAVYDLTINGIASQFNRSRKYTESRVIVGLETYHKLFL